MKKHPFTFGEMILIASCAAIVAALTVAAAKSAVDPKIAACADLVRGIDRKLAAWENDHDGKLIFVNAPRGGIWGRQLRDGGQRLLRHQSLRHLDQQGFRLLQD